MEEEKVYYNKEGTLKFIEEERLKNRLYILPNHPHYEIFKDEKGGLISDVNKISPNSWISEGVTCFGRLESSVVVLKDSKLRETPASGFICADSTVTNSSLILSSLSISRGEVSGVTTFNWDTLNYGQLSIWESKIIADNNTILTYSRSTEDTLFSNIIKDIHIDNSVLLGNFNIKVLPESILVKIDNCNLTGNGSIEENISNKYIDYEQEY